MRRYIKQIDREEFVYPNNSVSNYDNEIIHEVNDNYPTGNISGITISTANTTNLMFGVEYSFMRNGAELFKNIDNQYTLVSFHLLTPNKVYYKPWVYIGRDTTLQSDIVGQSGIVYFDLYPSDLGITGFTNGEYYLETRFIGKRSIQAVCSIFEVILTPDPTPTPTPTMTPTPTSGYTPTPTPTPTPTITPSSSAIYIGFDQMTGLLNLSDLGDNTIDITISGKSQAYQSWINCNYPPTAYANLSYYIDSAYIVANAMENTATSSNRDTSTIATDSWTFTGVTAASVSDIITSITNDYTYCGDAWGQCDVVITNITKTSGTGTILIHPTNGSFWTQASIE